MRGHARQTGLHALRRTGAILFAGLLPGTAISLAEETGRQAASIRFEGLHQLTAEQAREIIRHQVAYLEERGASPARADDAAYFLATGMRQMGFEGARVDWDIAGEVVVLRVRESGRAGLGSVSVVGNAAVDGDVLRGMLEQQTRSRMKGALKTRQLPFVRADIERSAETIRNLYANLGYYDATVNVDISPDGQHEDALINVRLLIEEGPLYRIATVEIRESAPEMQEPLDALIAEFEATPFTPSSADILQGRVLELFHSEGYSQAEISMLKPEPGAVDAGGTIPVSISVNVSPGERRVLRHVEVTGNQKVRETFFLQRFEPLQDKPYDEGKADRIVRRMLRSGAFSKVELQKNPVPGTNALDLRIAVEETPAREFGLFGGVGSWEGYIVGGSFQHYNLFGSVRRLDTRLEFTSRGISGGIDVFEPWALGDRSNIAAGLYANRRDNESYTKFEVGAQFEVRYDLNEHARISLFSRTAFTEILDFQVVPEELGDASYLLHAIGTAFSYDRRNDPSLPTEGYIFNVSADIASGAIGSEVDFARGSGRFTYYKTLGPVRAHVGARAGMIVPMADTQQLPIDVRLFNGGATTVRSFPERELGPQDRRGNPVGGEFYTIFNAEASVAVWKGLRVAGFADSGNLLKEYEDLTLSEMHHAAGAGLRYDLPIGPIRLDYGWNLNRKEDEPDGALHFGIGVAF